VHETLRDRARAMAQMQVN